MTKKNFIALADAIKNAGWYAAFSAEQKYILANFCAEQSARFDLDLWLGYIAGTNGPHGKRVKP